MPNSTAVDAAIATAGTRELFLCGDCVSYERRNDQPEWNRTTHGRPEAFERGRRDFDTITWEGREEFSVPPSMRTAVRRIDRRCDICRTRLSYWRVRATIASRVHNADRIRELSSQARTLCHNASVSGDPDQLREAMLALSQAYSVVSDASRRLREGNDNS